MTDEASGVSGTVCGSISGSIDEPILGDGHISGFLRPARRAILEESHGRLFDRRRIDLGGEGARLGAAAGHRRCPGRAQEAGGGQAQCRAIARARSIAPCRARQAKCPSATGSSIRDNHYRSARPRSVRRSGRALQGGSSGVAQIQRADRQYAEEHYGPDQGTARRQRCHQPQGGRAHDRRRNAWHRRGRQCLRRSLLHSRLRCPQ